MMKIALLALLCLAFASRAYALTPAWTQFRHHPVQRALWRCDKRFAIVTAGRGSGKTELAKRRLVRFLPVKKPWSDPRYFYAAPTQPQAKLIAWRALIALTPKEWIREIRISELRIESIWGSVICVVGMDQPQRIEGPQWDGGVLDESCDQKPGTFDLNVLPALIHRDGWCWRIGVPKRQGVGAKEFREAYEQSCRGELPDSAAFNWPSDEIISPEQLLYARSKMDAVDYREQFGAIWQSMGGGVFHAFDAQYNVRPCPYRPDRTLVIGSDFNVDPMAWCIGHRWPDRIEWIDEIWQRNTNTQRALDTLWQRYQSHGSGFEFYGDATGSARRTSASSSDYRQIQVDKRFKKAGRTIHYPKANPPVADRFAACNGMFCNAEGQRRMFVDPSCRHLIKDLEARYYKPGSREPADRIDLGHMTDAIGYVVYRLFPIRLNLSTELPVISIGTT